MFHCGSLQYHCRYCILYTKTPATFVNEVPQPQSDCSNSHTRRQVQVHLFVLTFMFNHFSPSHRQALKTCIITNLISEHPRSFYRDGESSKWNQWGILYMCFRIWIQILIWNLPKPQRILKLSIEFAISAVCSVYLDLAQFLLLPNPSVHD